MRLFHIGMGLALLTLGAVALLMRKSRAARHPSVGTVYFAVLTAVLSTGLVIGARRPGVSLFEIMTPPTFALGLLGFVSGKLRWRGWLRWHVSGMAGSYIGVVTALGFQILPRSLAPFWWLAPTVVGSFLIARTQRRLAIVPPRVSQEPAKG